MSGYDWEPEHHDAAERAREWDRADQDEARELRERDRLDRDAGEMTERGTGLPDRDRFSTRGPDPSRPPRSVISPSMHENEAA